MKRCLLLSTLILISSILLAQQNNDGYKTMCSFKIGEKTITIKELQDSSQVRENEDGGKFFKTKLVAFLQDKKNVTSKVLDSNLYTNRANKNMQLCVLVDTSKKLIYVFSNSKSPDFHYGMDGFTYRVNLNLDSLSKETVFSVVNAGWFSFFGGSARGNPELWHFSYAGRVAVLSRRKDNGEYANIIEGAMDPKIVEEQYDSHKNILLTSLQNVDYMIF